MRASILAHLGFRRRRYYEAQSFPDGSYKVLHTTDGGFSARLVEEGKVPPEKQPIGYTPLRSATAKCYEAISTDRLHREETKQLRDGVYTFTESD